METWTPYIAFAALILSIYGAILASITTFGPIIRSVKVTWAFGCLTGDSMKTGEELMEDVLKIKVVNRGRRNVKIETVTLVMPGGRDRREVPPSDDQFELHKPKSRPPVILSDGDSVEFLYPLMLLEPSVRGWSRGQSHGDKIELICEGSTGKAYKGHLTFDDIVKWITPVG